MIRILIQILNRIERELAWIHHFYSTNGLGSLHKIYLCYNGFSPITYGTYDLTSSHISEYITDKNRFYKIPRSHGDYMIVLKDKSVFYSYLKCSRFHNNIPVQYKTIDKSAVLSGKNILLDDNYYILKPLLGSGGNGVVSVKSKNGSIRLSNHQISEIKQRNSNSETFVIEESIRNHDYSRTIYNKSLNTIRLLTVWDYTTNNPVLVAASHRFGTDRSAPTDNVSKGGIFSPIELASGRIGSAFTELGTRDRTSVHPDTQKKIEGVTVRRWSQLKSFIVQVARTFPFCPWIGWDVVVDEMDRFVIIEGNPTPGVALIQAHTPLLRNPSVRSFLRHHSIL